jgi:uncharacterized CHY-type Zn-finger protein
MKKNNKLLNLVQIPKGQLYQALSYIASQLNKIGEPQEEELSVWKEAEDIVEAMTDQPRRDSTYKKEQTSVETFLTGLGSKYRDPNKQPIPLPQYAVTTFNQWARENPVRLHIQLEGDGIIQAGHQSVTPDGGVLCALWQFYFHGEGYKRLKRCPQCRKWFVDDTRNLGKVRCSQKCTNRWWARGFRNEIKSKFQICSKCKRRYFQRYRVKGILRKRNECPHCGLKLTK